MGGWVGRTFSSFWRRLSLSSLLRQRHTLPIPMEEKVWKEEEEEEEELVSPFPSPSSEEEEEVGGWVTKRRKLSPVPSG